MRMRVKRKVRWMQMWVWLHDCLAWYDDAGMRVVVAVVVRHYSMRIRGGLAEW